MDPPLQLPQQSSSVDETAYVLWEGFELRTDKPSIDLANSYVHATESSEDENRTITVERLLDLGADPNLVLWDRRTVDHQFIIHVPLLTIAAQGNLETIELLSKRGSRINKVIERVIYNGHHTAWLSNPFRELKGLSHLKAIMTLIDTGQSPIYSWLKEGVDLALHRGTQCDLEIVKLYLTAGAIPSDTQLSRGILKDLAIRQSIVSATLPEEQPDLVAAAFREDEHACDDVLTRNANLEIRGGFSMTALIISVGARSDSVCQLLLDRGADPNSCDVFGMSPLMEATYHGHEKAILSLLNNGAGVDYCIKGKPSMDYVSGTPTTYSRQMGWLVQRNTIAQMCETNGWSASHLAAHRGFTEILTILAEHGADLEAKDIGGFTPLDLANRNGHDTTANCILRIRSRTAQELHVPNILRQMGAKPSTLFGKSKPARASDDHFHEPAKMTKEICDICSVAFETGSFKSVNACSTSCRFCKMMRFSNDTTGPIQADFFKDSNATYLKLFTADYREVARTRVLKLSQTWHSLLNRANGLDDASTGSPAALWMAMGWHANCSSNHTKCKPGSRTTYFPTRVLDVRSSSISGRVKLINDPSLREPYVALSHRWGTESLPTTMCHNLAIRLEEFDVADLSPTMRDAIGIVQCLHYDYIWIDAICIVQDSEEDWLLEASRMCDVFSNAAVTIAVAGSVEHSQGIFHARQTTFTRPFCIPYLQKRPHRERADFDGDGEYYLFPESQEVRSRGPLDTRGWILQEQLLSRSILYFDQGEIFWDCITTTASESSPISASLLSETDPDEVWALKYIRRMIAGSENDNTRRTQISNAWLEIVKNYSNRELTKSSDRLIALQGIITPLTHILKEEPVAGMWRTELWRQLTWWIEQPCTIAQSGFSAPSWSWLGVPNRVYYHNSLLGEHPDKNTVAHKYTDLRSYGFMVDYAETTTLEGNAGVTGSLTVTAKSFSYRLTKMDLKKPVYRRWHAAKLKLNTGRWMLDRPIEVPVDIQCLIVAEDAVAKSLVLLCIVPISEAGQDGRWKRVGLCHWDGLAWHIPSFTGRTPETGTFTLV